MAYMNRQASVGGQHQLHYYHHHANIQRPAFIFNETGSGIAIGQGSAQNSGGYRKKYSPTFNSATGDWRLKTRQKQYQQQQRYQSKQYNSLNAFGRPNVNLNHESTGSFETRNHGHAETDDGDKVIRNAPIAMAQNLIKAIGTSSPHNTKGIPFSLGAIGRAAKALEKNLEESEHPGFFLIQTLFEIGKHFDQAQKRMGSVVEEERASRVAIDTFLSYMSRWEWSDGSSENENKSDGGVSVHSSSNSSSSNRNGNGNEEGCEQGNKKKESVDLISWDSDEEEKKKADLSAKAPESSKQQHVRPRPIIQAHRQVLLNAILEGKNALQLFLAIDAFELNELLLTPAPLCDVEADNKKNEHRIEKNDWEIEQAEHDSGENFKKRQSQTDYGSHLTMNLTRREYLHAAIQLTLRIRQPHLYNKNRNNNILQEDEKEKKGVTQAQQMLIDHLLDKGYADLIHLLVGTDRELCRTVLQAIDNRFAKQIWTWVEDEVVVPALLDPYLVVQCRAQASHLSSSSEAEPAPPGPPSYPLPMLMGMFDLANSLGYSFGLENTMKSFRSIQFIQGYCTVLAFLHQHRPPHATMYERFNSSPFIFIPAVLPALKGNVALQRLIVWTFAMREDGVATAEFLASALGLKAFFAQCLGHQGEEENKSESVLQNQQQLMGSEERSELARQGVNERPLLLEQPLAESHGHMFEMDANSGGSLLQLSPSSSSSSSKGKGRYVSHQEEGRSMMAEANNSRKSTTFAEAAMPLLSTSIAQMTLPGFNSHNHYQNHYYDRNGNDNYGFSHSCSPNHNHYDNHDFNHGSNHNYAVSLPSHPFNHQNSASHRPIPPPIQTKPSSTSTSYPALSVPLTVTSKSSFYPSTHLPTHLPTKQPTSLEAKNKLKAYRSKYRVPLHIYMLGYKPAPETTIILVNEISQLEQMYESLLYAGVVGMSLVRPLAKPWAREKRAQPPAQLQVHTVFKQGQEQKQTKEQQHPSLKQQKKYKDGGGVNTGGVNTDGETGAGGVFLQLACQNDNHVYVIDLEVFLDRSVDPLNKLPRLLGELFFNLSICKLAYNWNEESKLLKEMFPTLRESRYHMDNLLDFYFIWIAHDLSSTTLVAQLQSDHPQPQLQNPITTTTKTNKIVAGRVPDIYKIKAWCTEKPLLPTTMSQPRFENVSGLLYRVMGKFLRRTSSLGWNAWTIRPLPVCLQTDLAMSAQCLVDMFAVLDKPGARRDREETAEFKLQHKFKM